MYQVGQKVVYGIHGVCELMDIEIKTVDRKKISYFVLTPADQPGARFYVPAENPVVLAKLSPLLTEQALEELVSSVDRSKSAWIEDENRRKLRFRELIGSGDRKAILDMVAALHIHRKELEQKGKKFHLCDESFLHDGEKLLCSEIAFVLDVSKQEAEKWLYKHFDF